MAGERLYCQPLIVMAGLGPAIHDVLASKQRRNGPNHQLPNRVIAAQRIAVTDDKGLRRRRYSAAAFIPPPAASSACDRSPMISSMCSMPIDSRM